MKNASSAEQQVKEHRRGAVGATTATIKCRTPLSNGVHWICSRANSYGIGVRRLPRSSCSCGEYWMFHCEDCGECTHCIGEYYMVEDEVWYSAITARSKPDMLCLGCLEQRIGRLLTKDDFSDAPLNSLPYWTRSERFKLRLSSTGHTFHE